MTVLSVNANPLLAWNQIPESPLKESSLSLPGHAVSSVSLPVIVYLINLPAFPTPSFSSLCDWNAPNPSDLPLHVSSASPRWD